MSNLIRIVAAIFIPPLGVFLTVGLGTDFWINLVLTCFFWFPGMIHAIWIIAKHDRA
ncbi:YqaE/Pmp3 family membrane protein [Microcoleus sp. F10-C6]|uniref:YqaE/Pmp3 family membrane protein n=1 Tax=unclassified Microcoleus TaxID=2642155 RepID=UPI002FD42561